MKIRLNVDPDLLLPNMEVFAVKDPHGPSETYTGVSLICQHRGHGRVSWTEGLRRDFRESFSERWKPVIPEIEKLLTELGEGV